jgi:GNAT superfamily N-acetyltransferase
MRNNLFKKYEKLITDIKKTSGINIVFVDEIQDNEVFSKLKEVFETYFLLIDKFQVPVQYESSEICSIVEFPHGAKMKIHNCLFFQFPDGSHFRFSPHSTDSLEISRIMVRPEFIGNGIGTLLMEMFFEFVGSTLGEIPKLYLECTGSVGWGDNNIDYNISKQTDFFRKFGFRVLNGKRYPEFVSMVREKEILSSEENYPF